MSCTQQRLHMSKDFGDKEVVCVAMECAKKAWGNAGFGRLRSMELAGIGLAAPAVQAAMSAVRAGPALEAFCGRLADMVTQVRRLT